MEEGVYVWISAYSLRILIIYADNLADNGTAEEMKLPTQSQVLPLSDQPNQQQASLPSPSEKPPNTTKPWHSPSDTPHRKAMSDIIIQLIESKKPNADDWLAQLPQTAAMLEENLYFSADSLLAYVDVITLNARLQQLGDSALQEKQAGNNGSEDNSEDHSKKVLKQQQQRLLLLRHASTCKNDVDCKATRHCSSIKVLWKHIMDCKELKCDTRHCVSSRHVLSHYSKCKDEACSVCGPVRAAIRKSLSKRDSSQAHSGGSGQLDGQPMTKRVKLEEGVACAGQERADKEKSLRLHLALLKHSAYCEDSTSCKENHNCPKLKVSCHLSFYLYLFTI